MNERIKELAEQATTEEHDGFRYFDKKKFAELIIAECIKKVELRKEFAIEDEHNVDEAFSLLVYDIEEHFGIEE
jgi:hypothetical protein